MLRNSENLIILFWGGIMAITLCFWLGVQQMEANVIEKSVDFTTENLGDSLITIQDNSLVPIKNKIVVKEIKVVITGYSSTPEETDSSPLITASGSQVREGIVANNLLPFGTEIRIPEIYGDEIFVIEDRMHRKKGYYHVDIWFPSKDEAKVFGAKRTYIEVLEG